MHTDGVFSGHKPLVLGKKGCSKHSGRFAGLEACFLLVTVVFFLFLFDKFRLKHLLKHANKKKIARIAAVYQ